MVEEDFSTVLRANNELSKKLSEKLQPTGKSTIFSPINIYSILSLVSQDPTFYNKQCFNRVLNIPDINVAARLYKYILALLNVGDDVSVASRALVKHDRELQELFKTRLTNNFVYDVGPINFNRSEDAADTINDWISDKTFERIKINPGTPDAESRLTLLNTIHFSSRWTQSFKTDDTVLVPFHVNDNETVEVQMMKAKGEFFYRCLFGVKVLELPFINSDISLVVVLPDTKTNFCSIGSVSNFDLIQITGDMVKQEVDVSLPKFTIEESVELKQRLCELGLTDAFNAALLEVVKDEEINLSKVQQKTFIRVNEEGAETAAGTMTNLNALVVKEDPSKDGIIIDKMNMNTDISNRYAKTEVVWKLRNIKKQVNKVNFKVVLTETAFITGFVMEIQEKSYKSYIKEKELAKNIYNAAVARGQSAGLVAATARDSKEFTVSVNVEPEVVAKFTLIYEEMLVRVQDQYELVLNICPGQIVQNLNVEVHINESRPLRFVKTPPLRSGNEISTTKNESFLDPSSEIQMTSPRTAVIKFRPDITSQKKFTSYLGRDASNGLSGQFVLQYDVERDPQGGEVLLQDGYFVHYLAPNDLDPLPKHVVFVLDTSGSMSGRKITQLKDAMTSILGEMRNEDMINIIEFNSDIIAWDINTMRYAVVHQTRYIRHFSEYFSYLNEIFLPDPASATEANISNAKIVVEKLYANGGTFIIGALQTALHMVTIGQQMAARKGERCQPIIVFLTDGEPNVGLSHPEEIVKVVTSINKNIRVPIFSLSFGDGADKRFLIKLSLENQGFSRHIYEASDASLQLQQFYKQISTPLLSDVKFKYESEVEEVTRTYFPIYFRGSELVVCGRYNGLTFPTYVHCCGPVGPITIRSTVEKPATSLERLWAYLTVKQLLEERDLAENKFELTQKAVALALKYSFVTDVTSLVVVKPNETNFINTDYDPFIRPDVGPSPQFHPYSGFAGPSIPADFIDLSLSGPAMQPNSAFGSTGPAIGQSSTFGSAAQAFSSGGYGGPAMQPNSAFGSTGPAVGQSSTFGSTAQAFSSGGYGGAAMGQISTFGSTRSRPSTQAFSSGGFGGVAAGQSPGFGDSSLFGQTSLFGSGVSMTSGSFFSGESMTSGSFFSGESMFSKPFFGGAPQLESVFSGGFVTTQSDAFGHGASSGQTFSFGVPTNHSATSGGTGTGQSNGFGFGGQPSEQPSEASGGNPFDWKKQTEEFKANRPFHIFLQYKKENKVIVLFQGRVCKPV